MGKLNVDLRRSITMKQSFEDNGDTSLNNAVPIILFVFLYANIVKVFI